LQLLATLRREVHESSEMPGHTQYDQNDVWVRDTWIGSVYDYLSAWDAILQDTWDEGWPHLQSSRVALNNLTRLAESRAASQLDAQARYLDAAFGFNVFFSPEYEIDVMKCDICGEDPRSDACPHIRGQLYQGRMATSRIIEGRVTGLSIVGKPANRRAVVKIVGVEYDHQVLKAIRSWVCCPLQSFQVLVPARTVFGYEAGGGRNDPCPCDSGKKFKKCCLGKWYTSAPTYHVSLIEGHVLSVPAACQ
jgi:hypothetical protein